MVTKWSENFRFLCVDSLKEKKGLDVLKTRHVLILEYFSTNKLSFFSDYSTFSFTILIMKLKPIRFLSLLFPCLFACSLGHAYEQDNWYLHGPIDGNLTGVFHQEYNATARIDMLYKTATGVGLEVRDINGTLLQTIDTGGVTFDDIEFDQNTSRLFGINAGKLACFEQNASGGWSEQWRSTQSVSSLAQGPSGKLFCANNGDKIYVFEQNGTMSNEFGWVDGINSLSDQASVEGFTPGGTLISWGKHQVTGGNTSWQYLFFNENGSLIQKWTPISHNYYYFGFFYTEVSSSGMIAVQFKEYEHSNYQNYGLYNPMDNSQRMSSNDFDFTVSLWLQNGDFISGSNLYRRTFRTKMETNHNSVPQPVIHRIAQRTGTNVMELDFEVIDTDDDNVTVGILAHCGSDKLVPQAWLNNTGSKIGVPIATNTVHSMEWDVKQDWNNSTGAIQFEILCQDGSRSKPVDLHFLTLPFSDGNMTISRSPLHDSDINNYLKYMAATGEGFIENDGQIWTRTIEGNATNPFAFTNAGITGSNGPTQAEVDANYIGTNLEGQINITTQGIQEWTVPTTGTYTIQASGAQGGTGAGYYTGGQGATMTGEFQLNAGTVLKILVGQQGGDYQNNRSAGGGGGTFVVLSDNTPLIIAGGGSGGGGNNNPNNGQPGLRTTAGGSGSDNNQFAGGTDGAGGLAGSGSGGGGGLTGDGQTAFQNTHGISFINGGTGGSGTDYYGGDGGFGGGGAGEFYMEGSAGAGGGYSGGGGTNSRGVPGGGGSYNAGANQTNLSGMNEGHGKVFIAPGIVSFDKLVITVSGNGASTENGRNYFMQKLGYRWATPEEVTKAREAATPGAVNNWEASNQVKPRNLPGNVNEYGFDVSTTSGYWVIKE